MPNLDNPESGIHPGAVTANQWQLTYLPYNCYGEKGGEQKKSLKARATTGNDTRLQWPDLKRKAVKNPMRPCDANGKPPNRQFSEFKVIKREERGERCL